MIASVRRLVVVALACVSALVALATAPAMASAALPPQGLYEWCAPGATSDGCVGRLHQMGSAGFRVVVNYAMLEQSTAQQVLAYVNAAQSDGLQVIWPLNDFSYQDPLGNVMLSVHPQLAATCGCTTNQGLANYVVGLAKQASDTWGYYLADEPDPVNHAVILAFSTALRLQDPNHQQLLVANGGASVSSVLAPFGDVAATLSSDLYPVTNQSPDPQGVYNVTATKMRDVQALADSVGRPSAMVLQAFNWGDTNGVCGLNPAACRFPTEQEMEWQRDAAVANGHPQLLLWFGLFDVIGFPPGQQPTWWTGPSSYDGRWNTLVQAAFAPLPTSGSAPVGSGSGTTPTVPSAGSPLKHPRRCPSAKQLRRLHGKKLRAARRACAKHHRRKHKAKK